MLELILLRSASDRLFLMVVVIFIVKGIYEILKPNPKAWTIRVRKNTIYPYKYTVEYKMRKRDSWNTVMERYMADWGHKTSKEWRTIEFSSENEAEQFADVHMKSIETFELFNNHQKDRLDLPLVKKGFN